MELRLEGVTCERPRGDGGQTPILLDANLVIPDGSLTVIVGPSGAGKSTLLRLFNRLDEPSAGSVRVGGREAREWDILELRRRVAFVFQTPAFLTESVREDLTYGLRLRKTPASEAASRAAEVLTRVGLGEEFLGRRPDSLSVGQQQRVSLARALIGRPAALLADEPTSALDPPSARVVLDLLQRLHREERLTVALVTHDLAVARRVAERVTLVLDGAVVEEGPAEAFFAEPRTDAGARFLAEAADAGH